MNVSRENKLLFLIIAAGIMARFIKFGTPAMVMDSVAFSRLGKNLIEYGAYAFGENYNMGVFFPPAYPVFIGLVNLFFDDLFFSAKLVSFVVSCFSIILAYSIGKELYNKEAGLFAALVYALYPIILIISVDAYADAQFICFLLLSIYIFIMSRRKNELYVSVLFGLSISAAFLTRPEGMFLLLLPGAQLLGFFDGKERFNRRHLLSMGLIIVIFAVCISPYLIFIKNYTGKFSMSGKANVSIILGELSGDREYHDVVNAPDNLYDRAAFTLNRDKTQVRGWNRHENLSLKDYVLNDPLLTIRKYLKNVVRQIATLIKLFIPILLPFTFTFFNRELFANRLRLIFLVYPLIFFLMYPLFIIIEKQTLSIVLFLILFASGGFVSAKYAVSDIADFYGISRNKPVRLIEKSVRPLMILLVVMSSFLYLKYSSFDKAPMPLEHMRAGLYLKENVTPEYEKLNVMARKPYVNYYSGARFTMMPYADVADVINFAKLYNVDYIVIDKMSLSRWDAYDELVELQNFSDEIELFYEEGGEHLIRLFRIIRRENPEPLN